jgi:hypothetical protein
MNVNVADPIPILPIWFAKTYNFSCKGVSSAYFCNLDLLIPSLEFIPTARTIMYPVPSMTFDPEIKNGLLFTFAFQSYFLI